MAKKKKKKKNIQTNAALTQKPKDPWSRLQKPFKNVKTQNV